MSGPKVSYPYDNSAEFTFDGTLKKYSAGFKYKPVTSLLMTLKPKVIQAVEPQYEVQSLKHFCSTGFPPV